MDLNPPTAIHTIDVEVLLRLSVAALVGLLLGLDRELRGHAAGLRTHGIICFAAAAMTVSMIALYRQLGGEHMDPLRVFEATGAFIGIIGAGLIVFSRGQIKNLTTAAHLWLAAVAGVACGAGQWPLVAIAAVVSMVMLTLLAVVERRMGTYDDDAETSDDDKPAAKKAGRRGAR
jgi:putative Mg2+ transporter-C (MgtC) family protein